MQGRADAAGQLQGVHHVTAIAGAPQANVDFYVGVLGLRLVKRSVNQDDPGTYHLFFGDALGHPGTELTFFPWPGAPPGTRGTGQAVAVSLAVPPEAVAFWGDRLRQHGIEAFGPTVRFDEEVLTFNDPHGLALEIVAGDSVFRRALWMPWTDGPVSPAVAIRGVHGVTLRESAIEPTAAFLTDVLGFGIAREAPDRIRFAVGRGGSGALLDLAPQPGPRGRVAVGTVHHVAWRTPDAGTQRAWWERIGARTSISSIIDRFWFNSIYFHEPGGVLFEIATDGPGFTADETPETLGTRLVLPPWLESQRVQLEAVLPPLHPPSIPAPPARS